MRGPSRLKWLLNPVARPPSTSRIAPTTSLGEYRCEASPPSARALLRACLEPPTHRLRPSHWRIRRALAMQRCHRLPEFATRLALRAGSKVGRTTVWVVPPTLPPPPLVACATPASVSEQRGSEQCGGDRPAMGGDLRRQSRHALHGAGCEREARAPYVPPRPPT